MQDEVVFLKIMIRYLNVTKTSGTIRLLSIKTARPINARNTPISAHCSTLLQNPTNAAGSGVMADAELFMSVVLAPSRDSATQPQSEKVTNCKTKRSHA